MMAWRPVLSMMRTGLALACLLALAMPAAQAAQMAQLAKAENRFQPVPRPAFNGPDTLPDAVLYERIFKLQADAKWGRADRLINELDDTLLMGHVLYQRYMHPTGYRARWTELRDWLKNYADQPGAWRVYKLAQKRKPRGVAMPKRPPSRVYHHTAKGENPLFRTRVKRRIKNRVTSYVRRERPTQALKYISQRRQSARLSKAETDFLKSLIARSYYIEGKITESLKIAREATRSRRYVQMADWHAGLAAFRLGKTDLATLHFERLAENRTASEALRARGSFWAARSLRQTGEIARAETHFKAAAASGANFYALLAMQHIAGGPLIAWQRANAEADMIFKTHPALRRAEALREAGQDGLGEMELLYLQERLTEPEARALLAYARMEGYPAVQLALAERLSAQIGTGLPLLLYESSYPELDDRHKIDIDPALLFSLIRQESRFKAHAKSHAGARGLMQIMPRTAAFVTGDRRLYRRSGRDQLLDGKLNIEIGQTYLQMLLTEKYFDGNLIFALAGYNAGPGTVRRWQRELSDVKDPLLFIESMRAGETRAYVQKVMANVWIYRHKFGQEPTSQRILAAESWPVHEEQPKQTDQPQIIPAMLGN